MSKLAHVSFLAAVGLTVSFGACTINSTDNDDDDAATTTNPTTTSGGGEGGSGATGGDGGAGATGATGGMGVGGAGGGTGGGAQCVGPDGTGQTAAACDDPNQMPIAAAPKTCTETGEPLTGNQEPLGLITCRRAFEVYLPGPAEFLFDLLAMIPVDPTSACDHDNVTDAITQMHEQACDNAQALDACQQFKDACDNDGLPNDTLNQDQCNFLVNPFNANALSDWADCVNNASADVPCDDVALGCWDQVLNPPN